MNKGKEKQEAWGSCFHLIPNTMQKNIEGNLLKIIIIYKLLKSK
jgi:hypothetical protein